MLRETGHRLPAGPNWFAAVGVSFAFNGRARSFAKAIICIRILARVLFQDTDVKVDENGTTAKAATELAIKLEIIPPPRDVLEIRFDRPFAFAIVRIANAPITMFEGQVWISSRNPIFWCSCS